VNELQRYLGQGPGVKDGRPYFPPGYFEELVRLADVLRPDKSGFVREALAFDASIAPGGLEANLLQPLVMDLDRQALYMLAWLPQDTPSRPTALVAQGWGFCSFRLAGTPLFDWPAFQVSLPQDHGPINSARQRATAFAPEVRFAQWWAVARMLGCYHSAALPQEGGA
jgi:hypothetical protein